MRRFITYGVAQLVSQMSALVCGVLVVRSLDQSSYASYGVAIAVVAAVSVVSDAGVAGAAMARARDYVAAGTDGQFFRFVARYKWRWGIPLIILGAAWCGLLIHNLGLPLLESIGVSALVVLNVAVLLALAVRLTHLRVLGRQDRIAKSLLVASAFRVVGTVALYGFEEPALFLAWNACVSAVSLRVVGRGDSKSGLTPTLSDSLASEIPAFRYAARRAVPIAVALIVAEQACTWLIATRGGSVQLASVIAFTRFAAVFSLINSINTDWIVPRFAAAVDGRSQLRRRLLVLASTYLALLLVVGGVMAAASPVLLWALGPEYREFEFEFLIVTSGVVCSQFAYGLNALNLARGWVGMSWLYPVCVAVWFAAAVQVDVLDVTGAAVVYASLPLALLVTQIARSVTGLRRTSEVAPRSTGATAASVSK